MLKKKFKKKTTKPPKIAVLLLVLILLTIGYVLIKPRFSSTNPVSLIPTDTPYPTRSQPDYYDFFKYKLTSYPDLSQTVNWTVYENPKFGFQFKYPSNWVVSQNSFVFPQRDLITVIGNGGYESDAYFSIANPTKTSQDVDKWYMDRYRLVTPAPEKLETETINGMEFKKKFTAGEVCQTYYYLPKNGYIFEFALSTYCDEKSKEASDQTLINIINTLRFSN